MKYTPDRWVLLKVVTPKESFFKVLAGWTGGYLDGDSWKINSGITKVEEDRAYYHFHGHSGSVYNCCKTGEGFTNLTAAIWDNLTSIGKVSLVSVEEVKRELNGKDQT